MAFKIHRPCQLTDLPDEIILRIFSVFINLEESSTENLLIERDESQKTSNNNSINSSRNDTAITANSGSPNNNNAKKYKKAKRERNRSAVGLGARTLCRLCCCSHRFNHLASADQLWQPLTLARFPDRHWPTTDQKNLGLIHVRREHQLKILKSASSSSPLSLSSATVGSSLSSIKAESHYKTNGNTVLDVVTVAHEDKGSNDFSDPPYDHQDDSNKKQKRTKFYSRFEQRAHRRRFATLDPELKHTPLAWTNTMWTWKRTFFGDYRFVEAKDVSTPNRIDHAIHRNNKDQDLAVETRQECGRCWRPIRSCICTALTSQQYCNCRVRIMILQHPRCQVSIGTIRILKLSFKYCQIIIGKDFKEGRSSELDEALKDPDCTPLLLYPSHEATDIHSLAPMGSVSSMEQPSVTSTQSTTISSLNHSRYYCQGCIHSHPSSTSTHINTLNYGKKAKDTEEEKEEAKGLSGSTSYPYKLIIALDGSWSHAKIMYRCNPRLQQLTQIKFPNPPQSIYHDLKPEPKPTYTSTAEAVGQAVALLGWPETKAEQYDKDAMSDAQSLMEDLIRPLKTMIGIQDMIAQDQQKQPE
ncbi:DTW domain-domain-containing protein [Lobosporangium transversale]|uniref:tRNA-uridine aminocarboxypropyltransferase n=1 Tax=Lobosporangium transversale TaxID=64571 RepID=A0A1Y2G958_9FUNG|nr:DTW domain-domain-containing protein [Lobosporangium transversale]ORY94302.1 DTW domain-domain-containing protein [Lobosporangium transversale]|eukprot:XP_021875245.1 DTW domain-domain-containing protein [Lobosporangium transversale]